MKTDDVMIHAQLENVSSRDHMRSGCRIGVTVVVALFVLGACTSDPGARRVAEDIIKAEALANPRLDEECMLGVLSDISDDDLESMTNGVESANEETRAEAQAALDEYEADLRACN